MEPARTNVVRLVDREGQLVGEGCQGCVRHSKTIASLEGELTKLRNEEDERLGLAPDAGRIMEVLRFHKQMLAPHAKIVRGKAAWKAVKEILAATDAETNRPAFTVLHCKAAIVGLSLSAWHREHKKTSAAFLFSDPDRVQEHIATCVTFKREYGTSALEIVDELGGPGLAKLAVRCTCGHLRLDHERETPELEIWDPPCSVHGCACEGFDDWDHRVEMAKRGRRVLTPSGRVWAGG